MAGNKLDIKQKVKIKNRKASHEYEFIEKFVAGVSLKGSEIKSIRMQKVSLADAFCVFIGDELIIRSMHIAPYEMGGFNNHEAKADRKLLLHRKELDKLDRKVKENGFTVIPTQLFINDRGLAKIEVALSRGKKLYDKRNDLKEKDQKRELSRMKF
ncbi:SsrA-binding protein SmpB [Flammeovirga kamogawensis]|uniref:SsrA-binding protein n=1 Tax=Flammeovirga kamogawensis TaxID=373891 RepID=A0ABX8GYS4_9BACT|nr:SsrA-binding protein SmpB [Flammeovirga kamogawensis]MBB6458995.1 SsrA-binding protein [Flammeovirga kamogawensis]QWG08569.1 SsrA-binding protein SmpB [Flammeovirga kamogawensis]TRX66861.1 SsrA-binding protein SmpB [Flammeovirga kamogawensis]